MAPMPGAGPILMAQKDPQEMIDAMIEVIPDRHSAYRTMLPEGIAHDAASGDFFLGSTARGTITRLGFGNAVSRDASARPMLDVGVLMTMDMDDSPFR